MGRSWKFSVASKRENKELEGEFKLGFTFYKSQSQILTQEAPQSLIATQLHLRPNCRLCQHMSPHGD